MFPVVRREELAREVGEVSAAECDERRLVARFQRAHVARAARERERRAELPRVGLWVVHVADAPS